MTARKAGSGTIRVRQIRSGIGFAKRSGRGRCARWGSRRLGRVRSSRTTRQVRGMIAKVSHLVIVEEGR